METRPKATYTFVQATSEYLTYKEWKLLILGIALISANREYLTYKEWKHTVSTPKITLPIAFVSTLPIRNGNDMEMCGMLFLPCREYLTYKEWEPDIV